MRKQVRNCFVMILLILSLMLAACGHRQKQEESKGETTWQEQYDLGMKYLSEANYEEAIIAFTLAISIDPKQTTAYMGRGDAYAASLQIKQPPAGETWGAELTEMYENAEKDYLEVIGRDSQLVEAYEKLAALYILAGDREKAVAILKKGYEAIGDETLLERSKTILDLPVMDEALLKDAVIVTMYSAELGFSGHDAYSFDDEGRMISNIWYNEDNEVEYSEFWDYKDEEGKTVRTLYEADDFEYDEEGGNEPGESVNQDQDEETVTEILEGCEDQGWYWEDMDDFLTNPMLEAVNGRVDLEDGNYGVYKYDSSGRVVLIYTYDKNNSLLGYCVVTYYGNN